MAKGDRVVIPFNVSCVLCFMCGTGLQSQCETTQTQNTGTGAALLGDTKLSGQVRGGQAEYLRVPQTQYDPITCRRERLATASSTSPTCCP